MIVLLAVMVAALIATLPLALNRPTLYIYALAASVFGQNLAAMLLLRVGLVPIGSGSYLLYLKELILVFGLLYLGGIRLLTGSLAINRVDALVLAYLGFLGLLFLAEGSIPLEIRVAGLRSLALLPCLYLLGRWLYRPGFDLRRLAWMFINVAVIFAVFGLIEAVLLPEAFWLAIGHEEYYLMKENRPIQGLLYLNMYFWDLGRPLRRVASVTGDPLLSSYTMLYGALILGFWMLSLGLRRLRVGHLIALVLLTVTVLTFSRGAVVSLIVGVALLVLSLRSARLFGTLITVGMGSIVLALSLFGELLLNVLSGVSHIEGLQSGLAAGLQHPLGLGIGLSGNLAASRAGAVGADGLISVGGDSYTGSLAAQVGIVGLVLAYSIFVAMLVCLYQQRQRLVRTQQPYGWFYGATICMLAGLLLTSTINESGYSFTASGLIFVAAGLLISAAATTHKQPRAVAVLRPDAAPGD